MSENLKKGEFSRIKIRTIRKILGSKKNQSVQSVHFGHPVNITNLFLDLFN